MISAEISRQCLRAQTALLIPAALGPIVLERWCSKQVAAAGRISGPCRARGTPSMMCPTGSWENGVVRYRAGLRAFGAGKRPPRMSTSHSALFNHSNPCPVHTDRLPLGLRGACEPTQFIITRCPFAPDSLLPSLHITCTMHIGRRPLATPPRCEPGLPN